MHQFPSDLPEESDALVPPSRRSPTAVGVMTPPPPSRRLIQVPVFSTRAFREPFLVSLELVAACLLASEALVPAVRTCAEILFALGVGYLALWSYQLLRFFSFQRSVRRELEVRFQH